ncbi:ATP-dependent RecD-like DNA helicase, partial [Streptococcus pyogenes]
ARDLLEATLTVLEQARQVELDPAVVAQELTGLISDGKLQQVGTKIFDNSLYFAEEGIQKSLTRLLEKNTLNSFERRDIEQAIAHLEEEAN